MGDGLVAATDVVALAGASAWDLLWSKDRGAALPHLRARSIGPIQLARLGEVLGLGDPDTLIRSFSLLAGESQESPWVISIPETLTTAVASLRTEAIEGVASRWAGAEGMPATVSAEALQDYLERLQGLHAGTDGPLVMLVHTE